MVGGQIGEQSRNSDNWNIHRQGFFGGDDNQNSQRELDVRESTFGATVGGAESESNELVDVDAAGMEPDRCLKEVRRLIHKYITHLLGFQPKLYKFLENL
jgi:hypothetical protein